MSEPQPPSLQDLYEHGDIYDVLQECSDLEVALSRLRRLGLMSNEDFARCAQSLSTIRSTVETLLD
jgi:hypothetical protein